MSKRFGHRFLPHTADIGLEAWADSPDRLFIEAALGLRQMMFGQTPIKRDRQEKLSLEASDAAALLVTWLNEILYRFETTDLAPAAFRVTLVTETRLNATICGETYDPARHPIDHQVKAATYHQLALQHRPEGWHARIYFDL